MENQVENVQADSVNASELLSEEQVEETPQADVVEKTYNQADFDAEVKRKAEFIQRGYERKYQSDKRIGLADFLIQQTGEKNVDAAIEKIMQSHVEKEAEALSQDQTALAQEVVRMKTQPRMQVDDVAVRIAQEVDDFIANEELPHDFNPVAYDQANPGFLRYAASRGLGAALLKFKEEILWET